MRSSRQLATSGLSNPLHNPTPLPDEKDAPSSGSSVGSATRTRRQQTPYLCRIPRLSSDLSGFVFH
jgi:hypothetical protein